MGITQWLAQIFRKEETHSFNGPKILRPVHQSLTAMLKAGKFPGMAISVLHHEELIYEAGYGYADLQKKFPIDPKNTLMRAASASKPIAATALMVMEGRGEIDLDKSFYDYVPYFPRKKFDFTLRQLASHTAGIRSYRGKEYALNQPMSIREGIAFFNEDPLLFEPGTAYHYNSLGYVLLSLAMEEVSQQPFHTYVREHVLDPLGMYNTIPEVPGETKRAVCYTKRSSGFREAVPVDNRYKLAGGGYITTSSDLSKLGRAYLNGMFATYPNRETFLSAVVINGHSTYYGLGWEVSQDDAGRDYFGHTGNGVGGYSNFYVYPHQNVVIATLINCTDPKIQAELNSVYNQLFELLSPI